MPKSAEKKIKKQGGTARYRTIKKDGKTMTCAITKKAGPKGGHSVCWDRTESRAADIVNRLLDS